MPIATPAWGANGDKYGFSIFDGVSKIGGKIQPACFDVVFHQVFEARLEDRHLAFVQAVDLAGVFIDANHIVTEFREARS